MNSYKAEEENKAANPEEKRERLQKAIARLGIASRRHAEELIRKGLVKVNGRIVTTPGTKVTAQDQIEIEGCQDKKPAARRENYVYYLLHKPEGVITSAYDPQNRKTVVDILRQKIKRRVYPVGRLDYNTSGLLILTNDGELTYRLTHPRYGVDKVYRAWLKGPVAPKALKMLQEGVLLADGLTSPAKITKVEQANGGNNLTVVEITIHEGRNRQVRRMFDAVGHPLVRLQRIAFGPIRLNGMKPGEFRPLTAEEIARLRSEVGLRATE